MIRTIADLLSSLLEKEKPILDSYSAIKHPTIIGNMYEGLTKELLQRSVFDGLDLRVVDGKLRNDTGELSGQIDCMVVWGEGEAIPYTASYIYSSGRVVAVFEVKKNLYSAEIRDAHENLLTVGANRESTSYEYLRSAYWHVVGEDIPEDDLDRLKPLRRTIFTCLERDAATPLRIVLGYFGFKNEVAFQESIVKYLEDNVGREGFGPASLPNLIFCESQAILKLNGMPFAATLVGNPESRLRAEKWWPFYASRRDISVLLLLEVLWTRLRRLFDLPVTIFGQDLEIENLNCFLFAKPLPEIGWEYYFNRIEETELAKSPPFKSWQPHILEQPEFVAFQMLASGKDISTGDRDLLQFLENESRSLDEFLERMNATGLVQVEPETGHLVLLAESIVSGVSSQGEYFVDRADSPRSVNWALKKPEAKPEWCNSREGHVGYAGSPTVPLPESARPGVVGQRLPLDASSMFQVEPVTTRSLTFSNHVNFTVSISLTAI